MREKKQGGNRPEGTMAEELRLNGRIALYRASGDARLRADVLKETEERLSSDGAFLPPACRLAHRLISF